MLDRSSSLLVAVGGVLIADYYVIRRTRLDLKELYQSEGQYWYRGGFNPVALIAVAVGIAPCVPGFLGTVGVLEVSPVWMSMYNDARFISIGLSATCYILLTTAHLSKPQRGRELLDSSSLR